VRRDDDDCDEQADVEDPRSSTMVSFGFRRHVTSFTRPTTA
jgi:hypothetical protein